jgi:hypothetical protein
VLNCDLLIQIICISYQLFILSRKLFDKKQPQNSFTTVDLNNQKQSRLLLTN